MFNKKLMKLFKSSIERFEIQNKFFKYTKYIVRS